MQSDTNAVSVSRDSVCKPENDPNLFSTLKWMQQDNVGNCNNNNNIVNDDACYDQNEAEFDSHVEQKSMSKCETVSLTSNKGDFEFFDEEKRTSDNEDATTVPRSSVSEIDLILRRNSSMDETNKSCDLKTFIEMFRGDESGSIPQMKMRSATVSTDTNFSSELFDNSSDSTDFANMFNSSSEFHPEISLCVGCGGQIFDRFVLKVQEKPWHSHCLKCSVCGASLTSSCFAKGNFVFCKDDFLKTFASRCAACEQSIEAKEVVRRANSNVYHLECFRCVVCREKLDTGDQFYLLEDCRLVCKKDYEKPKEEDKNAENNKRPRTTINSKQLETLKAAYNLSPKPARHVREHLSQETGLDVRVVQVWFQNKRAKEKRMKKERPRWEFCDNGFSLPDQDLLFTPVLSPDSRESGKRNYKSENYLRKRYCLSPHLPIRPLSCYSNRPKSNSSFSTPDIAMLDPSLIATMEKPDPSNPFQYHQQSSLTQSLTGLPLFAGFQNPLYSPTSFFESPGFHEFFLPPVSEAAALKASLKSSDEQQNFFTRSTETTRPLGSVLTPSFSHCSDASSEHSGLSAFNSTTTDTNLWTEESAAAFHF